MLLLINSLLENTALEKLQALVDIAIADEVLEFCEFAVIALEGFQFSFYVHTHVVVPTAALITLSPRQSAAWSQTEWTITNGIIVCVVSSAV